MHCRTCGKRVHGQAPVCMACGCLPNAGNVFCPQCGVETGPAATACIECGVALGVGGKASQFTARCGTDVTTTGAGEIKAPLYPPVIGLAIFVFFPVGLYLLWKHPTLGRDRRWWWAGGAWGFLVLLAALNGDKGKSRSEGGAAVAGGRASQTAGQVNTVVTEEGAGGSSAKHDGGILSSSWDYKNGCQVIYGRTVTKAVAKRLGDFLERQGLFEGDTKTFKIGKAGKTYEFRVVIKKGLEQDPEAIEGMKQMGSELSHAVFGDAEVDVHLCDEKFRTVRVVVP